MSSLTLAANGKAYWRSLDQAADTPAFREFVDRTFPKSMADLLDGDGGIDRRRFLQLMAASIGLAGLSGCRRPEIPILPYTKKPESVIPGLPIYYATAIPRPGGAIPVLVESHEGRPTKIEGQPDHPDSGGATDAQTQATILDLYDPDRARPATNRGEESTWAAYDQFAEVHFAEARKTGGRGLCFLIGSDSGPAMAWLRNQIARDLPESRWFEHDPAGSSNARAGSTLAFAKPHVPTWDFSRAEVIVALDCDFLGGDGTIRHIREFAASRRPDVPDRPMSRLYAVENSYTVTGGMADHRLRIPAGHVVEYAIALARAIQGDDPASRQALAGFTSTVKFDPRWIEAVADDLRAHKGKGLIVAGRRQPPIVHAVAHLLNQTLGNAGQTVRYRDEPGRIDAQPLPDLVAAIRAGEVKTLVILGGNPAYDTPADFEFAKRIGEVTTTIRLGTHFDETSKIATWHLPEAHVLETWGDARSANGTRLAIQPLIEPLFNGRSALETVARIAKLPQTGPAEIVRNAFNEAVPADPGDARWRAFLHVGFLPESASPPIDLPQANWTALAGAIAATKPAAGTPSASNLELAFQLDSKVEDGRYANNGWLQEAPDPITKLTWDNAALFGPSTAKELNIAQGDLVRLELGGRSLEAAAMIVPGQADHSVSLALGYGRTEVGRVGRGTGFDAYKLRISTAADFAFGLKVTKTGRTYPLSTTQEHSSMEGRDLVREVDLVQIAGHEAGAAAHGHDEEHADIQDRPAFDAPYQWGMAIDLNSCVGCNACVVACQAENNIPIVGKEEVALGREMHWIRNDRYFTGDPDDPDPGMVTQAVTCQHCENAPCEVVCPVNAAVHNSEGLNLQVYNRCVGTRYCSNNCPYKVRRFNFFNYNERPLDELRLGPLAKKGMAETLQMQKNPDVTVRIRGVMEKCTYCLQRIERAKIGQAVAAGQSVPEKLADGVVIPACAQACPARAIVFGDVSDPESRVSKIKAGDRDYSLLGELNTKPRTTYQSRVRNPNPRMAEAGSHA